MFRKITTMVASFALAAISFSAYAADAVPTKVGSCARTRIAKIGTRLVDRNHRPVPDSGGAVGFANGLWQYSYDQIAAIDQSRANDPILICLISLPKNCPPGDNRGKFYTATNLRRLESWTLPDAEHMCGGA